MTTMGKYSRDRRFACLFIGLSLVQTGCGSSTHQANSPPAGSSDVQVQHVFIVVEENHSYSSVIGNSDMPYLNRLATTYAYAQGYYADTHPSIGNYFMLTAGKIITNGDGSSVEVTAANIVRHHV